MRQHGKSWYVTIERPGNELSLGSNASGEDATVGDARRELVCRDVVDIADIL